MEPIYYNTKIPAVTVCPERDYWIFLNWSSIHLSIKKKKKTWMPAPQQLYRVHLRYLQYPTGPLQLAFKEAYFLDFTIPVVPCFYISHCIRFSWHWSRANRELYEGLRAHNVQFHPGSTQSFYGTPATQWPITELQVLVG